MWSKTNPIRADEGSIKVTSTGAASIGSAGAGACTTEAVVVDVRRSNDAAVENTIGAAHFRRRRIYPPLQAMASNFGSLRGQLNRSRARQIGIRVVFGGTGRARRSITLFPPAVDAGEPAPPAPPSPANRINGLDVPVGVTVATGPPDRPPPGERGDSSAAEETISATDD